MRAKAPAGVLRPNPGNGIPEKPSEGAPDARRGLPGGADILRNWVRRSQREWSSEQPILGRMHWSPADEVISIAVRTNHVGASTLVTQGQWKRGGLLGGFYHHNNNCILPLGGSSSSPCDIWASGPGAVLY